MIKLYTFNNIHTLNMSLRAYDFRFLMKMYTITVITLVTDLRVRR